MALECFFPYSLHSKSRIFFSTGYIFLNLSKFSIGAVVVYIDYVCKKSRETKIYIHEKMALKCFFPYSRHCDVSKIDERVRHHWKPSFLPLFRSDSLYD